MQSCEGSLRKAGMVLFLLSHGHVKTLLRQVWLRVHSEEICYGFQRDLNEEFRPPDPAIPVELRFFEEEDRKALFGFEDIGQGEADGLMDRLRRSAILEAGIPQPYVGTAPDGSPCFIQWLMSAAAGDMLQSHFKDYLPLPSRNEVILEGVFIPHAYRGKKIMPSAMFRVAEKGKELGARWALTFVERSNLPSIRGVLQAGFRPHLKRRARWCMFRRRIEFTPLEEKERAELEASWKRTFNRVK